MWRNARTLSFIALHAPWARTVACTRTSRSRGSRAGVTRAFGGVIREAMFTGRSGGWESTEVSTSPAKSALRPGNFAVTSQRVAPAGPEGRRASVH